MVNFWWQIFCRFFHQEKKGLKFVTESYSTFSILALEFQVLQQGFSSIAGKPSPTPSASPPCPAPHPKPFPNPSLGTDFFTTSSLLVLTRPGAAPAKTSTGNHFPREYQTPENPPELLQYWCCILVAFLLFSAVLVIFTAPRLRAQSTSSQPKKWPCRRAMWIFWYDFWVEFRKVNLGCELLVNEGEFFWGFVC